MRLIDADELKEVICRSSVDTRENIINIIDNAPPVDFEKLGESLRCQIRAEYGSCDDCELSCPRNELIKLLDSERPQGEWIDHSEDEGYLECPICGCLTNCDGNKEELHYCWHCGADMRGGTK